MRPLSNRHFFPAGVHHGGLYLPNTAGPTILESPDVLNAIVRHMPQRGTFLEIGTWTGALAAHLADTQPNATVVSVDNFEFCPQNLSLWQANRRHNMRLYVGDSDEFFSKYQCKVNCVLVDGDHEYDALTKDLCGAASVVAPTGVVLAHDYGEPAWPSVKRAVDDFCMKEGWRVVSTTRTLAVLQRLAIGPVVVRGSRIRVAFAIGSLRCGGSESRLAATVHGINKELFDVVGVVVADQREPWVPMLDYLRSACKVSFGLCDMDDIAQDADIVVASGVADLSCLRNFRGRVVFVCPGHCASTVYGALEAMPYVTDWVAVSKDASRSVPFPQYTSATVLENGADTSRLSSTKNLRREWGIAPDEVAVGYVGRLSDEKNVPVIASAVKSLGRPYRLVVAGEGPFGASTDAIANVLNIVPDAVYQDPTLNVGDIYRSLDCVVLASSYEGMSNTLLEAWCSGVPVVSTPVGDLARINKDHGDVCITLSQSPAASEIAEGIRASVSERNVSTVQHAQSIAKQHFSSSAMCGRWEMFLASITTKC